MHLLPKKNVAEVCALKGAYIQISIENGDVCASKKRIVLEYIPAMCTNAVQVWFNKYLEILGVFRTWTTRQRGSTRPIYTTDNKGCLNKEQACK
jgi:hypothetical protein